MVKDQGKPTLTIIFDDNLKNVKVTLRRKGKKVTKKFSTIKADNPVTVAFDSPVGNHEWEATINATWNGQDFDMDFSFPFNMLEEMRITIPPETIDLENKKLILKMSRPVSQVDYLIIRDDGQEMGAGKIQFSGEGPGTPLQIPWEQGEGTVLKIQLTATDVYGSWSRIELIPWWVEIPHEEVHFETGSHTVPETEQYKIDDVYKELVKEVNRYGEFVQIKLYVAGYTDSVGKKADNQKLSDKRAHSLAKSFRKKGFTFPIYHQGFGEDAPAVSTPDNTDEIRNRRALYILSAEAPLPCPALPRGNWKKLK